MSSSYCPRCEQLKRSAKFVDGVCGDCDDDVILGMEAAEGEANRCLSVVGELLDKAVADENLDSRSLLAVQSYLIEAGRLIRYPKS